MSLDKKTKIDRIEVVENGIVQVRQATIITEDGNQISRTFHRWCITPGEDYSTQEQQVQDICKVTHTPEVIAAYQAQLEVNILGASL
ncbi:hypothetical protein UFOVP765_10 [uncultured Caudovirales phage]|uniref:Uncharacterized protein n=1 Tax=uncultured Caudovirales phage TaxID=2100421 RepID=A0A6J5NNL2_9CAUD|nr:hypothetical protein UFOVP765_10 [uncultured Caudovirales phage]